MILTETLVLVCFVFFIFQIGSCFEQPVVRSERIFSNFMIGFMMFSYTFSLLGSMNLLYKPILLSAALALAIFVFWIKLKSAERPINLLQNPKPFVIKLVSRRFLAVSVLLFFELFLFRRILERFLMPIDGYDALSYHIYAPLYALNLSHNLDSANLIPNSGLPLGFQSIYGWLSPMVSLQVFALINLVMIVLIGVFVYSKLIKFGSVRAFVALNLSMCLILLSGSTVVTSPSSDIALVLFSLITISELHKYLSSESQTGSLTYLSLFLGFLPFVKPFAGVFSIIVFIYISLKILKLDINRKQRIKQFSVLISGYIPILLWLLKNWFETSNPFFPMLQGIFKGIGYGPEVMTNEEDVRRSFGQLSQFIADTTFFTLPIDLLHGQLILWIAVSFISLSSVFYVSKIFRPIAIALLVTEFVMLIYIGPIVRYFLFVSIGQLFVAASFLHPLGSRRTTRLSFFVATSALAVVMIPVTLLVVPAINTEFSIKTVTNQQNYVASGITVNEPNFLATIEFLDISDFPESKRFALFGEGRALLFWPSDVSVFAADRRNPFANPKVNGADEALYQFQSAGFDYLILAKEWGFAQNVNLDLLKSFETVYEKRIIYANSGWKIFHISN